MVRRIILLFNRFYSLEVATYIHMFDSIESHYLPGGCAHAFPRIVKGKDGEKLEFIFDSGPTIVLGCSKKPYNPLRQVLNAIGLSDEVEWIPYEAWGMVEYPKDENELRWKVELGQKRFQEGPLTKFGGADAKTEFEALRKETMPLVSGAVEIPAMAMRSGDSALIPLLRYLPALIGLIQQGEETNPKSKLFRSIIRINN